MSAETNEIRRHMLTIRRNARTKIRTMCIGMDMDKCAKMEGFFVVPFKPPFVSDNKELMDMCWMYVDLTAAINSLG